jgi:hypothetical protein
VSRLHHSLGAHIRALQISRFTLFAFVEGKGIDPYFFGQVCRCACEPRGQRYQIQTATELPGLAEGKAKLIAFYRYIRIKGKLRSILNGKLSVLVFFLDKDVDDIKRTKCRSPHVIYTAHYDVENYIFRHGDFIRSISAAASIDPGELSQHAVLGHNWLENAAGRWREWTVLCLFSVLYTGGQVANYGNASKVNTPKNGPLDHSLYDQQLIEARNSSGLTQPKFDDAIERLAARVQEDLSKGTYDLVFKGKWYGTLLEMDLRSAFSGRGQMQNVGTKAKAALLATLDFNQHLLRPVVALLD